jgi:hypothetical protein
LDCYLRGISTSSVTPGKLIKGIKGAGDSKRADAWPESEKTPPDARSR